MERSLYNETKEVLKPFMTPRFKRRLVAGIAAVVLTAAELANLASKATPRLEWHNSNVNGTEVYVSKTDIGPNAGYRVDALAGGNRESIVTSPWAHAYAGESVNADGTVKKRDIGIYQKNANTYFNVMVKDQNGKK